MRSHLPAGWVLIALSFAFATGHAQQDEDAAAAETPIEIEAQAPKRAFELEEIIVTASRREQTVQDVVGGIQVFSGADLDRQGADGFEDYLVKIPGTALRKANNGSAKVGMRGVSNIAGNVAGVFDGVSAVGLYINEVPMQGSGLLPDLALYDLNRVEALKGPQGTLYGEGAMGGAIKMVLNRPNWEQPEGKLDTMMSYTEQGSVNNGIKGMLSAPVIDDLFAVRVVATARRESGYVDRLFTGEQDANNSSGWSLRGIGAFNIGEAGSLELLAFNDFGAIDYFGDVNPALAQELANDLEEPTFAQTFFRLYGATWTQQFEHFELTAVTSHLVSSTWQQYPFKLTANLLLGGSADLILAEYGSPVQTGAQLPDSDTIRNEPFEFLAHQNGIAQEFRMISAGDRKLDWIAGVFYRNRGTKYDSTLWEPQLAVEPDAPRTGDPADPNDPRGLTRYGTEAFEQYAAYFEGLYDLRDNLELTFGLRWFDETGSLDDWFHVYNIYATAYRAYGSPTTYHTVLENTVSGLLPKLSLAWYLSDELMAYGIISRGFRSGGPNSQFNFALGNPLIKPDYLWNLEIGTKTSWLDGRLVLNGSLFNLRWTDLQAFARGVAMVGQLPVESLYVNNVGDAQVFGGEFDVNWAPVSGLSIVGGIAVLFGEVTKPSPDSDSAKGSPLPNLPEVSASLTTSYAHDLFGRTAVANLSYQYVDRQTTITIGNLSEDGSPMAAYAPLRASYALEGDTWGVTLFVDNLLDERQQYARLSSSLGDQLTIGRPRTWGLQLRSSW